MAYTVSQIAKLSGVSVRTLHHYDELGLLRPSGRSDAGYRLYAAADLERLQQILFYRELGFALEDIRRVLDDPGFDLAASLRSQRELLLEQAARTQALVTTIDRTLAAIERGEPMEAKDMFDGFDPAQYEEEARERWGHTEAYKESARRTKRYGAKEWEQIKREGGELFQALADHLAAGRPAGDPTVMDVAEAHRRHIERWFYPCAPEMHRGLGQLYVEDPRFTANLDKIRAGLAAYARDAFAANAARQP